VPTAGDLPPSTFGLSGPRGLGAPGLSEPWGLWALGALGPSGLGTLGRGICPFPRLDPWPGHISPALRDCGTSGEREIARARPLDGHERTLRNPRKHWACTQFRFEE
jgi:hypothetical protein